MLHSHFQPQYLYTCMRACTETEEASEYAQIKYKNLSSWGYIGLFSNSAPVQLH